MSVDNESVANSAFISRFNVHKMSIALSFHRVREVNVTGVMPYIYPPGKDNPEDMIPYH